MQHFPVTDINPAMAHARRVIGAFEEHQITGFGRAGRRTDVIEPLVYLKLSEVHPFHTFRPHPFKVRDDAKMQEIVF